MNQKRTKGFTLIELLAVIVILAIIALIAVPVILNIIDKANKSAFKDSSYGVLNAAEYYYAASQLELEGLKETVEMETTDSRLEIKGNVPNGKVMITRDGEIALAVYNDRYCVTKGYSDEDITITEEFETCEIPSGGNTGGNTQNNLVTDITLNTASVSIINGGTYQIEATVTPENATNKVLTYTSNNEDVATVDANGLITGVVGGTATITISTTDGTNINKTVEVTVRQQVTSFELSTSSVTIDEGKTEIVTTTILPENAFNKVLNWVSNDATIATVSNGTITGVKEGSTTITVTTADGSNISKIINVTVKKAEKTLSDIGTTIATCVTSGQCTATEIKAGILVNIAVNDSQNYDFYVIKDDGNTITLIMSENLGDNIQWYADAVDNSQGPTTALAELVLRTNDWTNIPEKTYTVSGLAEDKKTRKYEDITVTGRARLLTYEEATSEEIGCTRSSGSCPSWMYVNLKGTGSDTVSLGNYKYGYWISTAYASHYSNAWNVNRDGSLDCDDTNYTGDGLRPVIELSKSL